jgi:hypothetical protein
MLFSERCNLFNDIIRTANILTFSEPDNSLMVSSKFPPVYINLPEIVYEHLLYSRTE